MDRISEEPRGMEDKGGTMDRDVSDEPGGMMNKIGQMDRITDV